MKRIVFTLLCGFVFTLSYTFLIFVMMYFLHLRNTPLEILGLPASFGYYVYKYLGGNDSADYVDKNTILFFTIIFAQPVLLYSLFAYLLSLLIPKIRKPKQELNAPPLPPKKFD